jgi:uncharacterized protein
LNTFDNLTFKIARRIFAALMVSVWLSAAFAGGAMIIAVDPAPLVISTSNGSVSFELEVADTDEERAAGLMFRTEFPKNRAMLFNFGQTRAVSMWMKNTPLPLDMLFVDQTGLVAGVAANTTPQSLDVISAPQPVLYVLELNAGQAAANNIKAGDRLVHPLIKK